MQVIDYQHQPVIFAQGVKEEGQRIEQAGEAGLVQAGGLGERRNRAGGNLGDEGGDFYQRGLRQILEGLVRRGV